MGGTLGLAGARPGSLAGDKQARQQLALAGVRPQKLWGWGGTPPKPVPLFAVPADPLGASVLTSGFG